MIDFKKLESYRENNRIEAKKATGGFPHSVWETYSAFANTLGGIILLGVEERADHSLHAVDLPHPETFVEEFWDTVNSPDKVSANVLSKQHVSIELVDGKHIVVIAVPRAQRFDRPVYIGEDPMRGAYRRNGEGDYKCSKEEVQAMLRDAAVKTQDMRVLDDMSLCAFDYVGVHRYRIRMKKSRPGHVWEGLRDDEFLYKLDAVGRGKNGGLHPTAAGILMFGFYKEIVKAFPHYLLEYRERTGDDLTTVISSASGDWSGNLYAFYFRVYDEIVQTMQFYAKEGAMSVHGALKDALVNCLINADYYGRQGIVIVKEGDLISFSNPGGFRIDVEVAKAGGVSDPRNGALIKMFHLIELCGGTGGGLSNIYSVWRQEGWLAPSISESFDPDRTTLTLAVGKRDDGVQTIKSNKKRSVRPIAAAWAQKEAIVEYLTDHASGTGTELCELLDVKHARMEELTADLIAAGIVVAEGADQSRTYRLKR